MPERPGYALSMCSRGQAAVMTRSRHLGFGASFQASRIYDFSRTVGFLPPSNMISLVKYCLQFRGQAYRCATLRSSGARGKEIHGNLLLPTSLYLLQFSASPGLRLRRHLYDERIRPITYHRFPEMSCARMSLINVSRRGLIFPTSLVLQQIPSIYIDSRASRAEQTCNHGSQQVLGLAVKHLQPKGVLVVIIDPVFVHDRTKYKRVIGLGVVV